MGVGCIVLIGERAEERLGRAEVLWSVLLAHMQESVMVLGDEGGIELAGPATSTCLGYEPEELIGRNFSELVHSDDADLVERALRDPPVTLRHRARTREGDWRWLASTFAPVEGGMPAPVMVISSDVSDAARLQEERERLEMERRVAHRLEAVGQLAAGIAHEINTPLQFVGDSVGFLGEAVDELLALTSHYRDALFADRPLSQQERREAMRQAEEQADLEYLLERIPAAFKRTAAGIERVRSIVMAMKRFSHTGSADTAPADINEAMESTLAVCCNEYKYVAEVEFRPEQLPPVTCNIGEINQVLLNLIINAAQAIEEQRAASGREALGHIDIRTWREEDGVAICIRDDGPGIPLELQDRIYEPFFTTKEVGKGTGQGLALARTTIERHRGRLECDSQPGKGTSFTIHLPLTVEGAGERP